MGLNDFNKSMKGVAQFSLLRLSDNVIYNIATPSNIVISEGIDQMEQMGRNDQGEETRLFSFTKGRKATAEVTFTQMQTEIVALRNGVLLEEKSYTTALPFKFLADRGDIPGVTAGNAGYGIIEDVNIGLPSAPRASVRPGDQSIPLTQQAFAQYSSWRSTPNCFAVGADRAVRISDNLVTQQEVVSMQIPITGTATLLSDKSLGAVSIRGVVVDTTNKIHLLSIPLATIDLSDAGLDLSADTATVKLFLNSVPGACRTWNLASLKTNNLVACVGDS
jgi:hypothetical protein